MCLLSAVAIHIIVILQLVLSRIQIFPKLSAAVIHIWNLCVVPFIAYDLRHGTKLTSSCLVIVVKFTSSCQKYQTSRSICFNISGLVSFFARVVLVEGVVCDGRSRPSNHQTCSVKLGFRNATWKQFHEFELFLLNIRSTKREGKRS